MLSIQKSVEEYLVPELKKINCIKNQEAYDLAYIPDFNSLIAISQQLSKPVFSLTKDDLKNTANVFGIAAKTMFSKIEEFKTSFTELSKRVIVLTE